MESSERKFRPPLDSIFSSEYGDHSLGVNLSITLEVIL